MDEAYLTNTQTIGNDDLLNKNYTLAYEHKNDLWGCSEYLHKPL
jgi:hypothetical protein